MTIPNRVFIMRPVTRGISTSVCGSAGPSDTTGGSKNSKFAHDALRRVNIYIGGDHINPSGDQSGDNECFSYDPVADVVNPDGRQGWKLISSYCHGPGKVTPARPDDGNPWGHDPRRDRYWACSGGWRITNYRASCAVGSPRGSTMYGGLLYMDPPSGDWHVVADAGDSSTSTPNVTGALTGIYDPVQDALLGVSLFNFERIYLGSTFPGMTMAQIKKDSTPIVAGSTFSGGNGDAPQGFQQMDYAWDIVGRWCYLIGVYSVLVANAVQRSTLKLIRVNLDDPTKQQALATPPFNYPAYPIPSAGYGALHPVWDSRNRKVIWFYGRTICGGVHGIGVYTPPPTDRWDVLPVVTDIGGSFVPAGNCVGYDPSNNVCILTPGAFCGNEDDAVEKGLGVANLASYYSLWRYA